MVKGLWVNSNAITIRTSSASANTVSIGAQMAVYLGTMYATADGQTSMQFAPTPASGGTNNILGLYNAYNRSRAFAKCRDANDYTYATSTWRAADNSNADRITWVDGLGQSTVEASYFCIPSAPGTNDGRFGINFDSTTAAPNQIGVLSGAQYATVRVEDSLVSLGLHYAQAMEFAQSGTIHFYGAGVYSELRVVADL
jgi:hypothetical protein